MPLTEIGLIEQIKVELKRAMCAFFRKVPLNQAHKLMKTLPFAILLLLVGAGCASRDWRGERSVRIAGTTFANMNVQAHASKRSVSTGVGIIDLKGVLRLIRYREGKPLLLNFWATWCLPCKEEFPDLVKIAKGTHNAEIIGISLDYPDEKDSKVVPFIKNQSIPFKIYIASFHRPEELINAIDSTWNGAIPATFFYDVHGIQKSSIIGRATHDNFATHLKQLAANQ
jgi:thiol-disulfide isomerase/thioredoxin